MWKANWEEARAHHEAWWRGEGLVLGSWGNGYRKDGGAPWADLPLPPPASSPAMHWSDPAYVSSRIRADMARRVWPADQVPLAWPDIGTVCLAPYLGAVPEYAVNNVWYKSCIDDPESSGPLVFDPQHPEVRRLEGVVRSVVQLAAGDYLVGMPAMISNMDVLSELRGAGELMYDLLDRPEWVEEKLAEIHGAWEVAWERMYHLLRADDGSMAFGYFMLWGRGRTGLLQCDVSATFSTDMFDQFVMPGLIKECAFLDHSMYHLDGHQCIRHLDSVLSIHDLDAVEWTPDPQVPPGGDPHWFPLYHRIRDAGKALWIAGAKIHELRPLLDELGGEGLYITVNMPSAAEFEEAAEIVEEYR